MKKRVGFACKWIDHDGQILGIGAKDEAKALNTRSLTLTWMDKHRGHEADMKLIEVMEHNLNSVKLLLERTASREEIFHMVRLGSDLLPLYNIPYWKDVYHRWGILEKIENGFGEIGDYARAHDIRLSFHPGEFTVLASNRQEVRENSLREIEYHADMAFWMGYGAEFQDLKINVHISGQHGAYGIQQALPHLSSTAKNCLTIENDELTWGIDESLKLEHDLALVIDIHHHWVKTGEYIQPNDPRMKRAIESWRGVRPVIHYSQPREEHFVDHDVDKQPDFIESMGRGLHKPKLRGHSDFYWNKASNDWAWSFHEDFDIMCESKAKNLSQQKFVEQVFPNYNLIKEDQWA